MRVVAVDPGRRNLAMCVVDTETRAILEWTVVDLVASPRGVLDAMAAVGTVSWIRAHEPTHAVVERQPAKNPSMKMMQHYLELYFASENLTVVSVDPKLKLLAAQASPWWPKREIDRWTYAERKKLAVETVSAMLETENSGFRDFFQASKKKDDLADAFLTALAFAHTSQQLRATEYVRPFKPRKPTDRQVSSGRYSQAGLKFLAKSHVTSFDAFARRAADVAGFEESCRRHFGTMERAYVNLGGS